MKAINIPDTLKKWILFDGPVDANWIENLNTVLDDNKMLCLPDGKWIKLPNHIQVLFEVESLINASPATVSRCGMIYIDEHILNPIYCMMSWKREFLEKI